MTRIFLCLAYLNSAALLASYLAGIVSKWRDAAQQPTDPTYLIHFTLGLFAAIGTLLVHCLIFTYFLGTGRWVKEVTLAYGLPDEPWHKETRELKRKTFPPALFAMLIAIATAAAGAGAQLQEWPWQVHFTLATLTLLVNLWAFRVEYRNVDRNAAVLDEVLREVDRVRAERGLPTNAEALAQEERV
jgi:amino acid transporter